MTNPYRALCAELLNDLEHSLSQHCLQGEIDNDSLIIRARALLAQPEPPELTDEEIASAAALDQPEPEGPKPVVDYSRVPEIATEAQIRSAAQYLVKKRNCDGDLIPAIEYAIARWGCPTPLARKPVTNALGWQQGRT